MSTPINNKMISERFKALRKKRRVSLGDLANILGVPVQRLWELENNAEVELLSLKDWKLLANLLDVPVCYFIMPEDEIAGEIGS